jgi:hypothetical protein
MADGCGKKTLRHLDVQVLSFVVGIPLENGGHGSH